MGISLFVTGASGFLGAHFLARLDPSAYDTITLLTRRELELPARLAHAPNVRVARASLHQTERYAEHLDANTCVLHLAAVTDKADRPQYFSVNTHATGALIRAAERADVRGFLFISSKAVSFRKRHNYHYAESKDQAEQLLRASSLRYTILRPTIILGPDAAIWKRFQGFVRYPLIPLPGNGKIRIQPVYVDDMVRILEDFIARNDFANRMLEIGGPEILTLDDFVRRIRRASTGKGAWILHLPLVLVLAPLRILESFMTARLPVSSGQFASFYNDGIVVANETLHPSGAPMLDVDAVLKRLVAADVIMQRAVDVKAECSVFGRYLGGKEPAAYVCERYAAALELLGTTRLAERDRFDRLLLKIARLHPLLSRSADSYSRYFRPGSVVRRRLVMLLAILETHAESVRRLDRPDCTGLAGLVFGMGMRGITSGLLLLPMLLLLPLQFLLAGRAGGTESV